MVKNKKIKINLNSKLSPTWQFISAVIFFFVTVFASRGADMHPWEIKIFNSIYHKPEFIYPIMFFVTQSGSIHMLAILLLVGVLIKNYAFLTKLLLTSTLAFLIAGFAKEIWGRVRPNEVILGVSNLDYIVRGPGFPSGHTALATAMALVVSDFLPQRLKFLAYIWIILVAYSRLYLGVHAPLDILGGFAIGLASYALVKHLVIKNILSSKIK